MSGQKGKRRHDCLGSINTISDLLSNDDCKTFLEGFIKKRLPDADKIALIYLERDGTVHLGSSNMGNIELLGAIEAAKSQVLDEIAWGSDEKDNPNTEETNGDDVAC